MLLNLCAYIFYQVFWGSKPQKAIVVGIASLIVLGLFGGEYVSAMILLAGNVSVGLAGLQAQIGLLGGIVGVWMYFHAFDYNLVGWWGDFGRRMKKLIGRKRNAKK